MGAEDRKDKSGRGMETAVGWEGGGRTGEGGQRRIDRDGIESGTGRWEGRRDVIEEMEQRGGGQGAGGGGGNRSPIDV